MIVDLPSTTTQDVSKKLVRLRSDTGSMALTRVLTLVVVVDENEADEANEGPEGTEADDANEAPENTADDAADGETNDDATDAGPDADPNEPGHQDAGE